MNKRLLLFFSIMLLLSCSSPRTVVRTKVDPRKVLVYTKPVKKPVRTIPAKPTTKTVAKTIVKKPLPAPKKPVVVKPKVDTKTNLDTLKVKPKEVVKAKEADDIQLLENLEKAKEVNKSNPDKPVYSRVEVLEATSKVKVTKANVLFYINQYKSIAKSNMVEHGIPASIILAQGILESGTGKGSLSLLANNHFGIKCKTEWTGKSVFFDDDAEQECFRKYETGEESYIDHAQFLTSRPYYIPLFSLEKDDYKGWAYGLKEAGYATDVKYPTKLISIIERYSLHQFDAEVLGKIPTPSPEIVEELVAETTPKVITTGTYQVMQGDTLYSISRKYNISVPDLIKKNNIENNSISIGQYLIIQ